MNFIKLLFLGIAVSAISIGSPVEAKDDNRASYSSSNPQLVAHSEEFREEIIKVTEGVYQAVGYSLANSMLLVGDDGVVIIDTTESEASARRIKAEFEKISSKPIKAIIYTHNHADHTFGAKGFVKQGQVPIYAHSSTNEHIDRIVSVIRPAISRRSYRMFGNYLVDREEGIVNDGVGPALLHTPGDDPDKYGLIKPDHGFDQRLAITIAGINIELVHAPGESDDQIYVWLPDKKVLLPGDNIYKAFPNLYTIRGTHYRDVQQWANSIDMMSKLGAEFLVPSHGRAVAGKESIDNILNHYRDAIQYVHDQTIRGINQGLDADTLAETIKLPPHLAQHPWLQPLYGTVDWSVRGIYNGYLGWYDGNASQLFPTPKETAAKRWITIAGGPQKLLTEAKQALPQDPQWAAELCDMLLNAQQLSEQAESIKALALRKLAAATPNPNARNWYLTQALELEKKILVVEDAPSELSLGLLKRLPLDGLMKMMAVNIDPQASHDINTSALFHFPDRQRYFLISVHRGVALIDPADSEGEADIKLQVNSDDWIDLIGGQKSFPFSLINGTIQVEGGVMDSVALLRFLMLFQTES